MINATIQDSAKQRKGAEGRETGRIVVHTVGDQVGLMRLDMNLPEFATEDEVREKVKLAIPGEASLHPTSVVGVGSDFVILFYSSDIANAGHLPAEAVLTWETPGPTHHTQHVRITTAEDVQRSEGIEAVSMPGGDPTVVYPTAVGILVVVAIFLAVLVVFAVLL